MNAPRSTIAALALGASIASADIPPDYGFDWAVIGDPGNRGTNDDELGFATPNNHYGAVDYTYRMATTEVTVAQYFEFVEAYLPYYEANTGNIFGHSDFTGGDIRTASGQASIREGVNPDKPIDMGWEYAARFVNWLHNGKATNEEAFETGVYDTSTFTQNDDGSWNHQVTHNPNATFWLPTRDEWTKAAYWDPELNDGEGGYHMYPNSSSEQSLPETERNAGDSDDGFPMSVGSFPDTQSPWGILDMEGGVSEWGSEAFGESQHIRYIMGSPWYNDDYGELIHIDQVARTGANSLFFTNGGIRLVSIVPSPSSSVVLAVGVLANRRRRVG